MQTLQELLAPTDVLLISDEVYEHMVFDGARTRAPHAIPAWRRAPSSCPASARPTTSRAGKSVMWPRLPALTAEFRKVHQFNVFTVNTPMQHGLAEYLQDPAPYLQLPAFYQAKRDLFRQGLAGTRLKLLPSKGSYFPVRGHLRRERPERGRLLPMAHARDRRGRHSAVGLLRQRLRPARGALLLCQEGRNATRVRQ